MIASICGCMCTSMTQKPHYSLLYSSWHRNCWAVQLMFQTTPFLGHCFLRDGLCFRPVFKIRQGVMITFECEKVAILTK